MDCIGIDLGTTHSLVAVFDETGPRLIPNALGELLTPSVVGLADDRRTLLVGRAAKMRLVRHPDLTAAQFKRSMGTDRKLTLGNTGFSATELSAMVLRSLRRDAEAALGREVTGAVISVPAYFNGLQRQATKDAAELAGLRVLRLINEPTAAALAAGVLDRSAETTMAVLDLGGGTFDVSILQMFEGVMEVRASSGDAQLGGEDFTARIAEDIARRARLDWHLVTPGDRALLLSLAEDLKRRADAPLKRVAQLSTGEIEAFLDETRLAELTRDLVARMRRPIETCLGDARLSVDDIDRVLLVGGATRMAEVRSLAARVFRKLPERSVDPDHAIALGAAVQAGLVARHQALDDVVMTDVSPFSLGVESGTRVNSRHIPGRFTPIIERNTILPASRSLQFETAVDNQSELIVPIYQGEAAVAADNLLLGQIRQAIPPAPQGQEKIDIRFTYDVSGLLAVDVKVLSTGATSALLIENLSAALSDKEKARRLSVMEGLKVDPRDEQPNRALVETLKHLYTMLLGDERARVQGLLDRFEAELLGQNPHSIAVLRLHLQEVARQIEQRLGA